MNTGPTSNRDKKLVYHLTAVRNLRGIRQHGILSRRALIDLDFVDVADPSILDGRADLGLDAMVPFHFIPCNPFDYAVVRGHPDQEFALIAVSRTLARQQGWRIIPKHPLTGEPEILDWEAGFQVIDWNQMDKYPRRYNTDHECKMVCMAEALSPTVVPLSAAQSIYVPSDAVAKNVVAELQGATIRVNVNDRMFPRPGR